jgi:hypothetical protein
VAPKERLLDIGRRRRHLVGRLSALRPVSNAFLLNMAEVSGSLIGLFLVGVFFYVESGFRRLDRARTVFEPYIRAGTRITLIVFAIPLGLSLSLVALEIAWSRALFVNLSAMLLVANVDTVRKIGETTRVTRSLGLLVNEIVTTLLSLILIVLPWILGGLHPDRQDLTWAILLAFAAGFLSICATVLSAFDMSRFEASSGPQAD